VRWYISNREMASSDDGIEVSLLPYDSEILNMIQGGRTDQIHVVMEIPKDVGLKAGEEYFIGLVIDEAFEPYGLQMKMTCNEVTKPSFDVEDEDEMIFELPLTP
jgi:hypothetical protein